MPLQLVPFDSMQPGETASLERGGAATFRYSTARQLMLVISLAIILVIAFSFTVSDGLDIWTVVITGLIIAAVAWTFVHQMGSLTIDAEGVRRTGPFGSEKMIRWADLTIRNDSRWRNLILRDIMGDNKILVDDGLDGFSQAVDLIRVRRSDIFQAELASPEKRIFIFNWLSVLGLVILLAVFTTITVLMLNALGGEAIWILLLIELLFISIQLISILSKPVSVRFEPQALAVRYLFGEKQFLVSDLQDIHLEVLIAGRGGRQTVTSIIPRQGKSLYLRGPFNGGPWLYCLLKTWWEAVQPNS